MLTQAVERLTETWTKQGPLDLSDVLAVVPTRQSGRRLREALAELAARHGAAVFPPRVMLPEALLAPVGNEVASRLESLLAWAYVFGAIDLAEYRSVFPVDPPARTFAWALRLAEEFIALQRSLAESGLRLGEVTAQLGAECPERERWQQIAGLERAHDQALEAIGRRDAAAARIAQAQTPVVPAGVRRVVILSVPDPQPLALTAFAVLARQLPVEIVVYAPAGEAAAFDGWGRPLPEVWSARVLVLPEFERRVHLRSDPAAEAEAVADLARRYAAPDGLLGVGVADPDVLPLLEHALDHARLPTYNPEGRPRQGDALFQLLQALARLARESTFFAVEALARCPDFLAFLGVRLGPAFSAAQFLRELDTLHTRHLPPTLHEALRQATAAERPALLAGALGVMRDLRAALTTGPFPENAMTVLADIFRARRFDLSRPEDARAAEAAETWTELLRDIARVAPAFGGLTTAEGWDLALRLYGESVRYPEKPPGAIELQGWLELLWEDAPHLVVAGFNDGRVPDAIVGDRFLPESLRLRLGLKSNAVRFARDAYLLQALAAWRSGPDQAGRLDLVLAKTSTTGDPLRPSRLLLRCPDSELPARIAFLFRGVQAANNVPSWRRAWRLAPRLVAPPPRVAVTGLRAWLGCPFRFYLSRVLRMETIDPGKTELDVFDFGTLCHAALEAMGREPLMRDVTHAPALREFLLARLERDAARRFGPELTLPLLVQLESARQRLSRLAEVQAETRADGWVVEHVERPFEVTVSGMVVTGKIDRIDRHERTGAVRVLDYKTSDRPVSPAEAHLRPARREESAPALARFTHEGREYVWTDLQLPLYLRAVIADPALNAMPANVEAAYFNLPKAAGETGIAGWEGYSRELDAAAWGCAEAVAAAIRSGEFWPPNESIPADRDDFAALFHHGVADSVQWPGNAIPEPIQGAARNEPAARERTP